MSFHIFHSADDFWKTVNEYKNIGYTWIQESHFDYNPKVTQNDMPCVLNADDNRTMMFSIIELYKDRYFKDPKFVILYNQSLRKKKLETIYGKR